MRATIKVSINDWESEAEQVIEYKHSIEQIDSRCVLIDDSIKVIYDEDMLVCNEIVIDVDLAHTVLRLINECGSDNQWSFVHKLNSLVSRIDMTSLLYATKMEPRGIKRLLEHAEEETTVESALLMYARIAHLRLAREAWNILHPDIKVD